MNCFKCGLELTADETGLYKKLINRGAAEFMCIECLSVYMGCTRAVLERKIEEFRAMGCILFPKK